MLLQDCYSHFDYIFTATIWWGIQNPGMFSVEELQGIVAGLTAIVKTYNMKMNAVGRCDQILSASSTQRKCVRWWKVLFFHRIDIAVVNSFLLFQAHRAEHTEIERPTGYSQCDLRDEIVQEICGFEEYGDPPCYNPGRERDQPSDFETVHVPCISEQKKSCVVCYKQEKVQRKVYSYCASPQCQGKHMHVTKERNCFDVFHSREYHTLVLKKKLKKKIFSHSI